MDGTLKADKHFVAFAFDYTVLNMAPLMVRHEPQIGYVWMMGFIDDVSYLIDIMPMDEARHMYE